jgi:outer membrane protein assembly factor BamB
LATKDKCVIFPLLPVSLIERNITMRRSSFALLLFFVSFTAAADDWTVGPGGKPARYGRSAEVGPTGPNILWQGGISAVISQQAVIEGNIVAMARIQNISDVLHGTFIVAHNLTTGDTLWTKDLPVEFPSTDWRNRVSAIRDGKVFVTRSGNTNSSYLYALNATNGAILWRSQDPIDESTTEGASFAPNGDLIVGNFTSVTRINAVDGTRIWRTPRSSPTSDGSQAAVFGNRAYTWEASGQGPKITALDLTTGARLYSSPAVAGGLVQQLGPFVGPDGTVYAPRSQNNITTDFLVAYKDTDTSLVEKWRVPLGYVPFATFGVGPDGSVYSYMQTRKVIRLNPQTGAVMDSSQALATDNTFAPRIAIDTTGVIFLTNGGFSQGMLYSFNANLTLRWSAPITNVNLGGPAIGRNGTMIVCGVGTDVRAYRGGSTSINDGRDLIVSGVLLEQNYPDPFNPTTRIEFSLPLLSADQAKGSQPASANSLGLAGEGVGSHVTLRVYDILGCEVATLVNEEKQPGQYMVHWKATGLASGVYFYRLEAGSRVQTRKLTILK